MKTHLFKNKEEWLNFRKGKITGTILKDIVSTVGVTKDKIIESLEKNKIVFDKKLKKEDLQALCSVETLAHLEAMSDKKIGYYQLIADRLAVTEEEFDGFIPNETPMDRGTRLQKFAVERFRNEHKKKVDESLVIWTSDDNDDITVSPDGVISKTEALETKCLSSAKHIEAYLTNKIPDEYEFQKLQYFIVNEKLKTLYFTFYDPRIPAKDFFVITVERADIENDILRYKAYQIKIISEVNEVVNKLLNF